MKPALIIQFLFLCASGYGQQQVINDNRLLQAANSVAAAESKIYTQPDISLNIFTKALPIFKQYRAYALYAQTLNDVGVCYFLMQDYKRCMSALHIAENETLKYLGEADTNYAYILNTIGMVYNNYADDSTALLYHLKAKKIIQQIKNPNIAAYSTIINNVATDYQNLGRNDKALRIFNNALDYVINYFGEDILIAGYLYNNIGLLYCEMNFSENGLPYLKSALRIFNETLGSDAPQTGTTYNNLGAAYINLGDRGKGETYIKKAIAIHAENPGKNSDDYAADIFCLSTFYAENGMYSKAAKLATEQNAIIYNLYGDIHPSYADGIYQFGYICYRQGSKTNNDSLLHEALVYFKSALHIYMQFDSRQINIVDAYRLIANSYCHLNSQDSSVYYFLKAEELAKSIYKTHSVDYARVCDEFSLAYSSFNKTDDAKIYALKALSTCSRMGKYITEESDFSLKDALYIHEYCNALGALGLQYSVAAKEKTTAEEKQKQFQKSVSFYKKAVDIEQENIFSKNDELSVGFISADIETFYSGILASLYNLYTIEANDSLIEMILYYSELKKNNLLLKQTQMREVEYSEDFFSVGSRVGELKMKKAMYETRLNNEYTSLEPNEYNIKNYTDSLLATKTELDALEHNNYVSKFDISKNSLFEKISLHTLQASLNNNCIIEYVYGDYFIYALYIDKTQTHFLRFDITNTYLQAQLDFIDYVKSVSVSAVQYKSCADTLYHYLLKPFESFFDGKNICIISDRDLLNIPFEALTTDSENEMTSYNQLHYLIYSNAVQYYPSLHLINALHAIQYHTPDMTLAFSPTFNMDTIKNNYTYFNSEAYTRSGYDNLKGTRKEINGIKKYFNTEVYTEMAARESAFKVNCGNKKIIHIASHAFMDDDEPLNSCILFAPEHDSLNDGKLYSWELYDLPLQADMVVLSACNTGTGRFTPGEGVASLARAFYYAGAKSVVTSLWDVNDSCTSVIMQSFYKYLSKGYAKDDALRNAKIDFLKNANSIDANPYYWAAFISTGLPDPVVSDYYIKLYGNYIFFVGGIFILIITLLYIRMQLKKN